jgi:hypothetical protein
MFQKITNSTNRAGTRDATGRETVEGEVKNGERNRRGICFATGRCGNRLALAYLFEFQGFSQVEKEKRKKRSLLAERPRIQKEILEIQEHYSRKKL